jgi:hypothetical protein
MRALIHKLRRTIAGVSLLALALTFGACATEKKQALVNDPDAAKGESWMPWNKQESWETGSSQLGGMTDRR